VIAVSAYAAALIGVVIALIAYWQASGRPSLEPEITFPRSLPNELVFEAYRPLQIPDWVGATTRDHARMLQIDDVSLLCTITIKNSFSYAAQNPGLQIRFEGLYLNILSAGWSVAESWGDRRGAKAIQWDGGTENKIHGKWSRKLPDLDFIDAIIYQLDPPPELEITIVSDGCRPKTKNIKINLRSGRAPRPCCLRLRPGPSTGARRSPRLCSKGWPPPINSPHPVPSPTIPRSCSMPWRTRRPTDTLLIITPRPVLRIAGYAPTCACAC
jgi:hypothetical protein